MTAPGNRSGFDESMISAVITATEAAIGEMNQVRNRVSYLASALPSANNSESGLRLARIFTDWTSDFRAITGALDTLNHKAHGLRDLNIQIAQYANTTVQGATGMTT